MAKDYQNGKFDVEMLIKGSGSTQTENKNLDVVLVVDRSGSMKDNSRMENAKKAAKGFVDNLLKDNGGNNVRVGLVSFAGNNGNNINPVLEAVSLQKNKNNLKNVIDKYQPYSGNKAGTFTQAALRKANELFEDNNHKKIIVLVSDGEPTYAYGTENVLDFNQIEKANSNTPLDGYEIWSRSERKGEVWDDWKKGYDNSSYESWFKTYWWTPYYVKIVKTVPILIGNGRKMTKEIKDNTINEAKAIKGSGVEVFSVGIGVEDEGTNVLKAIASPDRYYASNTYANDLAKILKELHNIIINYNIMKGSLEIKMNDKVNFKNNANLSDLIVSVVKKNYTDVSPEEKDSFDKRKAEIMKQSNWKWDSTNKILTLSNITLGEQEELTVTYKAELQEEWKDGEWKALNATALLYPKGKETEPDNKLSFVIPEVEDIKTITLTVNKTWVGPAPSDMDNIEFIVFADRIDTGKTVTVTKPNSVNDKWTGKLDDLPKYKNGTEIEYTVKEQQISGYESNSKVSKDNSGNFIFDVTNKNVEKTSFTVKKEWASTPDELKFDVEVQLYADGQKYGSVETINRNNLESKVVFSNLPKYDEYGKEIKYSAKELRDDGTAIEHNGSFKNDNFNFNVTYTPNGDNDISILNTCLNPQYYTFDVNLTKTWEGGVGDKAEFVFTNINNNNVVITKEFNKSELGNSPWKVKVSLPKYNPDGSKAVYTVTEKEVPGFTSTVSDGQVDFENPSVNATNKRNIKNITVTKVWENTPKELETEITVYLYENDNKSNKFQKIAKGVYQTTFENLPETKEDGTPIEYTFREDGEDSGNITLGDGEEFAVRYDDNKHTITNTYKKLQTKMIKVTLIKKWGGDIGNGATFNIKNIDVPNDNGIDVQVTAPTWRVEKELRKYNDDGTLAKYKVTEHNIIGFNSDKPDGEEITKDGQEIIFTNTQIKQKLTIKKEWVGTPNNAAFTLTYQYKGSEITKKLSIPSNESTVTEILPVYDLNGDVIRYTVTEEAIEGYQAELEKQSFKFTDGGLGDKIITFKNTAVTTGDENTYTIIKNWQGKPADSAYFGLFDDRNNRITGLIDSANNNLGDTIVLSKNNGNLTTVAGHKWTRTINLAPLPKVYNNGTPRTYKFKEMTASATNGNNQVVEDGSEVKLGDRTYKVTYVPNNNNNNTNTFEFTNTDVTKGNIEVTKKWVGTHQPGLKVGLFKRSDFSSAAPASPTTSAVKAINGKDANEIITFSNINLTDDLGQDIDYVARELDADGNILEGNSEQQFTLGDRKYKVSYDDKDRVITNTEYIDITVKKEWAQNVPTSEQQSVDVQLYDDGDGIVNRKATLTKAGNWEYKFENLPYAENGYSVKEININGRPVEELGKLFKITIDGEDKSEVKGIRESKIITITNSINISEPVPDPNPDNKIKIKKYWETNATPAAIKVAAYSKVDGEWKLQGATDMNGANDAVWEGEITLTDSTAKCYVLETSVGEQELTKEEIKNLLDKLENEGKAEYQIGEYDVLAQRIPGTIDVLIKNMSKYKTTRIKVKKDWTNTPKSYQKPVTVKLYKEKTFRSAGLEEVATLTLTSGMGWTGWFNGIPKLDDTETEINYYVAEVGIGEFTKGDVSLTEITNGYTIGTNGLYKVQIEGDGTEEVTIKNDIERVNIEAEKLWAAGVTKVPVEFKLYSKKAETFTQATGAAVIAAAENMSTTFTGVPLLDETGEKIIYYVFETKIGDTVAAHNYSDNYTVKVPGGTYTVDIRMNGVAGNTDRIYVNNAYTPDSTGEVVPNPQGDTPSTTPTDTPSTTPTDTPSTTPTDSAVDVPSDPTPQGNISEDEDDNEDDEDGIIDDIEDDETPQDGATTEDPIDIDGESTPKGSTGLPKTGGTAGDVLALVGMGLIGLGLVTKKRK